MNMATEISIHKALAGLDYSAGPGSIDAKDFNPQGPRGPRQLIVGHAIQDLTISIPKALAGLDAGRGRR